jgi:molecular chaperone DnaK (HSP70)
MTEDHIGNLKAMPQYSNQDVYFIEQFQSIIKSTFQCFGKRWYELTSDDLKCGKSASFKIIERNEFPCIYFDDARCYTTNRLVGKFFEAMLKCVGIHMRDYDSKLKNLCITIPSDFHTYQRLTLKNCLETIGLNNYIMVNKSTSLALPFLAKNLDDSSKKFIIDFGSGLLICIYIN